MGIYKDTLFGNKIIYVALRNFSFNLLKTKQKAMFWPSNMTFFVFYLFRDASG